MYYLPAKRLSVMAASWYRPFLTRWSTIRPDHVQNAALPWSQSTTYPRSESKSIIRLICVRCAASWGLHDIKRDFQIVLFFRCHVTGTPRSGRHNSHPFRSSQSPVHPILQDYLEDCGLGVLKDKISVSECPLRKPRP